MRLLPVIATLALLAVAPASAQQNGLQGRGATESETGDLCDIVQGRNRDHRQQATHLVELQNDGREIKEAIGTVNREARNPIACGPAMVMFRVAEQGDGDQLAASR